MLLAKVSVKRYFELLRNPFFVVGDSKQVEDHHQRGGHAERYHRGGGGRAPRVG